MDFTRSRATSANQPQSRRLTPGEQIRRARPDFDPDTVVAYAMAEMATRDGALIADGGAFRSRREWYEVHFSCVAAANFSAVERFEFSVGDFHPARAVGSARPHRGGKRRVMRASATRDHLSKPVLLTRRGVCFTSTGSDGANIAMNPLIDDKAPYVLVLLVSLMGWFLTSAVADASKTTLISYDLRPQLADQSEYLEVVIRNQSLGQALKDAEFVLACPKTACITKSNPKTNGAFATAGGNGPWTVAMNPAPYSNTPTTVSITFTPTIPASAELKVLVGLVDAAVVPTLSVGVPKDAVVTPQLEQGFSVRGWIFANYFWIMVSGAALSFLVFLGWVAVLQTKKAEVAKNEPV